MLAVDYLRNEGEPLNLPMRRYMPEPIDTAVFHRDGMVYSLGDGLGDDRLPLLREPIEQRLLLFNKCVDLRRLLIEKTSYAPLDY